MLTLQRTTYEFNAMFRLLARKHGVILLIFSLWIILKHFLFFKFGSGSEMMSNQAAIDSIASPDFIFLVIAIFISIDAFSKLRSSVGGTHYLLMPSNTVDKFAAAWFYSTFVTFITFTVTYNLTHVLCMITGNLIYDLNAPVNIQSWSTIQNLFWGVMFFQSIYFWGSAYFKKNPVGKTTLVIIAVTMVLGLTATYVFEHVNKDAFTFTNTNINIQNMGDLKKLMDLDIPQLWKTLFRIAQVIFYTTPFLCWGGAYLALKNKEV
jgi:hypothetical protein